MPQNNKLTKCLDEGKKGGERHQGGHPQIEADAEVIDDVEVVGLHRPFIERNGIESDGLQAESDRGHRQDHRGKALAKVQDITPVKIHDIVQTINDLQQNLKKSDTIVTEALHKGIALWGFEIIVQAIKNATEQ